MKNIVNWKVLLVLLMTILWSLQDTSSSKNRQLAKNIQILSTKTPKKRFYPIEHKIRVENRSVRARSHLNYFTKCLRKKICLTNVVDIKLEHFNIAFAINDIKESL